MYVCDFGVQEIYHSHISNLYHTYREDIYLLLIVPSQLQDVVAQSLMMEYYEEEIILELRITKLDPGLLDTL